MKLEEKGIPTVLIITRAFVRESLAKRTALGMGALEPAVIDHPLSTLTEGQIEERARQAVPQVVKILAAGDSP